MRRAHLTSSAPRVHRRALLSGVVALTTIAVGIPAGVAAAEEPDVVHTVDATAVYVIEDGAAPEGQSGFDEDADVTVGLLEVDGELLPMPEEAVAADLKNGEQVVVTVEADPGLSTDEAMELATTQPESGAATVVDITTAGTGDVTAELTTGAHQLVILPVYWDAGQKAANGATQAGLQATGQATAAYWERQSSNAIDVQPVARDWRQIAYPGGCDPDVLMASALAAHGEAAASPTRHVVVYFPNTLGCSFAGRATVGGGQMWINGQNQTFAFAHELGHNFGLGHANTMQCFVGSVRVPLSDSCTAREYGDNADVMGQGNNWSAPGNISSAFADLLGYARVQPFATAPAASTTVEVAPLGVTSGLRAVKTPWDAGYIYADYRPAVAPDTQVPAWAGVQVHLLIRDARGIPTTYLLDMQTSLAPFTAAALPVGAGWEVPRTGITLTNAGASATNARIGVGVSSATQQVQRYVTRVYADLFRRAPDPVGLAGWTDALLGGTPRIAVANSITYSDEYRRSLIAKSYQTYLGRAPDPAGADGWLAAMHGSATIQQMEAGFIASTEYYAQAGGTDAGWVNRLYQHVLGRQAASVEVDAWVTALAQGGSRYQVAMGFLVSTEHLTSVVDGYYRQLLGRGIDPEGARGWVMAIQGGYRVEAIMGGLVASDEYYTKP